MATTTAFSALGMLQASTSSLAGNAVKMGAAISITIELATGYSQTLRGLRQVVVARQLIKTSVNIELIADAVSVEIVHTTVAIKLRCVGLLIVSNVPIPEVAQWDQDTPGSVLTRPSSSSSMIEVASTTSTTWQHSHTGTIVIRCFSIVVRC